MGYNKRPKDFRTLDLDETRGPTGDFVATFRLSFPQKPHQDKPSDMRRVGATFFQRREEAISHQTKVSSISGDDGRSAHLRVIYERDQQAPSSVTANAFELGS